MGERFQNYLKYINSFKDVLGKDIDIDSKLTAVDDFINACSDFEIDSFYDINLADECGLIGVDPKDLLNKKYRTLKEVHMKIEEIDDLLVNSKAFHYQYYCGERLTESELKSRLKDYESELEQTLTEIEALESDISRDSNVQ